MNWEILEQKLDNAVTLSHFWVAQETEISQWEVPYFFLRLTFHMNKTWSTVSLCSRKPYANEAQ